MMEKLAPYSTFTIVNSQVGEMQVHISFRIFKKWMVSIPKEKLSPIIS
jgi:hypothetical protein